jgi:glycosyltransferase involved in cell wall biosynthesis
VRQALDGLCEADLLGEYVTFFMTARGNIFDRLAKLPGASEFERRRFPEHIAANCAQKPWPELLRLVGQKLGMRLLVQHQTGFVCPDRNNIRLGCFAAKRIAKSRAGLRGVYCYEDAALEAFLEARRVGICTIYDLPTGYWRAKKDLFEEERVHEPVWSQLLPALEDNEAKLERKERELELADFVITASSFTNKTLDQFSGRLPKTATIPYGAPARCSRRDLSRSSRDSKLRCLFVGSLSQQKGLSYLFEAVKTADAPLELTVVGRSGCRDFAPLNKELSAATYYPSLPNSGVLELMANHDVLIFPTLFDGFGLVILEAMSQGCVVIASTNCGAPDVIHDGQDGFVVPIRDPRAIADRLEILHGNRDRLASMSDFAQRKAQALTWEVYRHSIVSAVREALACS